MKYVSGGLECIFLKEGFTNNVILIRDEVLADAFIQIGVKGIISGADLKAFLNTFDPFSLRVRAIKLHQELKDTMPAANAAISNAIAA